MCMVRTLRCNIYVILCIPRYIGMHFCFANSHKDRILRQILMEVMFYAKYSSS